MPSNQSAVTACWDRRGVCVPYTANRKWRSECRGAAQPVHGFPQADVDVSPPRDPGVMNRSRKESGTEYPGDQVRPGTEQPYLGPWVPRGNGTEEVCGLGPWVRGSTLGFPLIFVQ